MIKYDWNNIAMQKWNIFKGNLFSVKIEYVLLGDNHYLKKQQPSCMEGGPVRHNFERDTPRAQLILEAMFVGQMEPNEEAM
jgi:hypothetical protein